MIGGGFFSTPFDKLRDLHGEGFGKIKGKGAKEVEEVEDSFAKNLRRPKEVKENEEIKLNPKPKLLKGISLNI